MNIRKNINIISLLLYLSMLINSNVFALESLSKIINFNGVSNFIDYNSAIDIKITDFQDNIYKVVFTAAKIQDLTFKKINFVIFDNEGKSFIGSTIKEKSSSLKHLGKEYTVIEKVARFQGNRTKYQFFEIDLINANGEEIKKIKGVIGLQAFLKKSKHDGVFDTLELKNPHSIFDIQTKGSIKIDWSNSSPPHKIKLVPDSCSQAKDNSFEEVITIEYEIDGKKLKSEIKILCYCDNPGREAIFNSFKRLPKDKIIPEKYAYILAQREDGSSIADFGKGLLQVTFATSSCDKKIEPKLSVKENPEDIHQITPKNYLVDMVDANGHCLWNLQGPLVDSNYSKNGTYFIQLKVEEEKIEYGGDLPDLAISIEPKTICPSDYEDCLRFENIIDSDIEITGIENDGDAKIDFESPLVIGKGKNTYLNLSLPSGISETSYTFPMSYKVGDSADEVQSYIRVIINKKTGWIDKSFLFLGVSAVAVGGVGIWKWGNSTGQENLDKEVDLGRELSDEEAGPDYEPSSGDESDEFQDEEIDRDELNDILGDQSDNEREVNEGNMSNERNYRSGKRYATDAVYSNIDEVGQSQLLGRSYRF